MNIKEWLEGIANEYGQEACDKCAAIISEANREKTRQKTIAEIVADGNCYPEQASLLYFKGYRKFEIVEEDV